MLLLISCRGPEVSVLPSSLTDVYVQNALRELDVLLVVDSSGSMVEEQEKLAANFQSFIEAFVAGEVDYHIGVITTDLDNQAEAGQLRGDVKVITLETPDAEATFASNVRVGTGGSGLEMGLEAARLALSEPLVSSVNAGLFRTTASLSIVVFSDENDMSPWAVDDYLDFFASLKGEAAYRDHSLMNISAVVGDVPFGCEASDGTGVAYAGTRYVDAATRTHGVVASICAADFSELVSALGVDISGLEDLFPLTRCAKPDTLHVTVGGRVEERDIAYTYVWEDKAIRFAPGWIPGPGELIEIQYEFYAEDSLTCPSE